MLSFSEKFLYTNDCLNIRLMFNWLILLIVLNLMDTRIELAHCNEIFNIFKKIVNVAKYELEYIFGLC